VVAHLAAAGRMSVKMSSNRSMFLLLCWRKEAGPKIVFLEDTVSVWRSSDQAGRIEDIWFRVDSYLNKFFFTQNIQ
jgi:hypothetical protein